jgi:hypothetical protein
MATIRTRFKRTTPFQKECGFVADNGFGEFEQCEADADFGVYFGDDTSTKMVSWCIYHTIWMESLWRGERK